MTDGVVVPRKATPEMYDAWSVAEYESGGDFDVCYAALIAAAETDNAGFALWPDGPGCKFPELSAGDDEVIGPFDTAEEAIESLKTPAPDEDATWLRHQAEIYFAGDDKFAYQLRGIADRIEADQRRIAELQDGLMTAIIAKESAENRLRIAVGRAEKAEAALRSRSDKE